MKDFKIYTSLYLHIYYFYYCHYKNFMSWSLSYSHRHVAEWTHESRDIANLTLNKDCYQVPLSPLCCLFCPLSLSYCSCTLRDHCCYNKASISCLKSNCDVSEYVLLLLGYGDQDRIKIYKFKWDLELSSEWTFSNKDCRVFNQKVIHSFNPMLLFLLLALGMFP